LQLRLLLALFSLLAATTAAVDEKDPGIRDTVELAVATQPDEAHGQFNVELKLYVFNDSTVLGATAGFFWDNPNLHLDSARPSALTSPRFDGGTFLYRADNIDSSNAARQFIFGGFAITGGGVPPVTQSQLWATYYFTLSDWTADDSVLIDSTLVPPAGYLFFVVPDSTVPRSCQQPFVPLWKEEIIVKDVSKGEMPERPNLPETYSLSQNYPNPFNPRTHISYELPVGSHVTLTVYNILGQKVTTLVDKEMSAGRYVAEWDGASDGGRQVSSGVYLYKLEAGNFIKTRKMLLLK
jgi:hypothetical protein